MFVTILCVGKGKESMAIINLVTPFSEGSKLGGTSCMEVDGPAARLYATKLSHEGLCVYDYERNGRDDSDFYMVVWNEEKGEPEHICFASTRGWSYPCYGSWADATPEVKAKYDAWVKARNEKSARERDEREAKCPRKGKLVTIVNPVTRGKNKCAAGESGVVFWEGPKQSFGGSAIRRYNQVQKDWGRSLGLHNPVDDLRIGVEFSDGRRVFIDANRAEAGKGS
jgi:hypothetical protein